MKIVIVTAALILDQEKVLVSQRREGDAQGLLWEFPGGKVREGEDPRQALQRELKEELDIKAKVGMIFEVNFYVYPEYPVLLLVYRCDLESGVPRPLGCRDVRWIPVVEMENLAMPPADLPILKKLRFFQQGLAAMSSPQRRGSPGEEPRTRGS
jgi:8-oxo-dGTP diphosphatase